MDPEKRNEFERRRAALQVEREATEFLRTEVDPMLELFDVFQDRAVDYRIVQLLGVDERWRPYIQMQLRDSRYKHSGFSAESAYATDHARLVAEILDVFPSTNEFRYVPDLQEKDLKVGKALRSISNELNLPNQKVYFYYLKYAPLIELNLYQLADCEDADLFNFWHGDTLIFSSQSDWLIAFSLEEVWYGGFRRK